MIDYTDIETDDMDEWLHNKYKAIAVISDTWLNLGWNILAYLTNMD